MTPHLTHEQLCDLLLSNHSRDAWILSSNELEAAREHVSQCPHCALELASLGDSLAMFRSSANTWSSHEWSQMPAVDTAAILQSRRRLNLLHRPLVWAASAALAIAIAIPVTMHTLNDDKQEVSVAQPHHRAAAPVSDEALLEEINQTLSTSVPSPMQPLADPLSSTTRTPRKN